MPDGHIPEKAAERIRKVGDWYNRMEGCLENHDEEPHTFGITDISDVIINQKDGKTYMHFFHGLNSSAIQIYNWPANPKRIRLMNTGEDLPFKFNLLERTYTPETKDRKYIHIQKIPADEYVSEPIVIEITWETSEIGCL